MGQFVATGTFSADGQMTIELMSQESFNKRIQEKQRIKNLREEVIQKLKNQHEKELHKHIEFQEVFKLFQLEVEQAKKLVTEAEYTDPSGNIFTGYNGWTDSYFR